MFCTVELNQNWLQTEKNGRVKFDLIAKIENLGISIKILTMRLKVSRRRSQRCSSSESMLVIYKKLLITVADQRETQTLLTAAFKVLTGTEYWRLMGMNMNPGVFLINVKAYIFAAWACSSPS